MGVICSHPKKTQQILKPDAIQRSLHLKSRPSHRLHNIHTLAHTCAPMHTDYRLNLLEIVPHRWKSIHGKSL